jgi:hypothetical protein
MHQTWLFDSAVFCASGEAAAAVDVVVVASRRGLDGPRVYSMPQVAFPHGIPEDIKKHEELVHPDQILQRFRPDNDPILIDAMAKKML